MRRQSTLRLSENGEHGAYTQRSSAQRMNKQAGAPIKTNSPSRAIFSFGNFCQPIDKFKSTTFVSIIAKIRRQTLCKKCGRGSQKKIKKKNEGKSTENEKLRSTIKEPSMRGTGFGLFQGGRGLEWAGCFVQRYWATQGHPQSHKRAGTIKQNKPKTDLFLSQLHRPYRVEKGAQAVKLYQRWECAFVTDHKFPCAPVTFTVSPSLMYVFVQVQKYELNTQ